MAVMSALEEAGGTARLVGQQGWWDSGAGGTVRLVGQ